MKDFKMGVKRCDCGVNIAEKMPACQACQIKTLTSKLQALRYIVAEYNEEVRQGCPADELPDLEKALAETEEK